MTKVELPVEKSPYLQFLKKGIDTYKSLIELLNTRKSLINDSIGQLSDYDKNERQIQLIKTDIELAKLHTSIAKDNIQFENYSSNMTNCMEEMETKWDELMAKAKQKSIVGRYPDLQAILETEKPEEFESNLDSKVNFYLQVKAKVYPNKEAAPQMSRVK